MERADQKAAMLTIILLATKAIPVLVLKRLYSELHDRVVLYILYLYYNQFP